MYTDFQIIAEPLIRNTFPSAGAIAREDECRGVVNLEWRVGDQTVVLSWEPFGPPWAQIAFAGGKAKDTRLGKMEFDPIIVSPDMKTEIEVRELLKMVKMELEAEHGVVRTR